MDILALDFDGVICRSAPEACATGWKAAGRLWPDRFVGEVPSEILEGFERVRPVMEVGFEAVLLVRLLRDGHSVEKILGDATSLYADVMRGEGLSRDDWVHLVGSTRDHWMEKDLPGWIDRHDFFDGTIDALNSSDLPIYIITTKEKRFAVALCVAAGLRVPEEKIFGLESGKKLSVLQNLSGIHTDARFHFLEDRLSTLIDVYERADFDVRLYWAQWGYHTPAERGRVEAVTDIIVLSLDQFPDFAHSPSRMQPTL